MIDYKSIRKVHLEISTRCNAACPDCLRNFRGVNVIDNYPLMDMSLATAQKIFSISFLNQLDRIFINGNYGDFVTAADGVEIVEYFLSVNPKLEIMISTNASAKSNIWQKLGALGVTVWFRLDGLKDTHHLYRQNTDYDLILDNASKFIAAGGTAVWAMIIFDHNRHQISACRELSKTLGFKQFQLVDTGRNTMPVFNSKKELTHVIGDYRGSVNFDEILIKHNKSTSTSIIKQYTDSNKQISCYSKNNSEIYIAVNGEVYPCCWLGFYPMREPNSIMNLQLAPLVFKNNALDFGIESAIEWFNGIEQTWKNQSVAEGRLYTCEQNCGRYK